MTPNYQFVLAEIERECGSGACVLDFGCGRGDLVEMGRRHGFRIVGADTFQTPDTRAIARKKCGALIYDMVDGRLPFPDASFDAVAANQVFEHVADLALALREIARVLRSGGVLVALFPTIGVLREGHCGMPLSQWLQPWPRLQFSYLLLGRSAGLGLHTNGRRPVEWARHFSWYLQNCTTYRRSRTLTRAISGAIGPVSRREVALATYRLAPRWARWARAIPPITRKAVNLLGCSVILARKPAVAS